MVSRNTTLVPFLGVCIGPACEAGLSVGMRRKRVPPQRIKIKRQKSPILPIPVSFRRLACMFLCSVYWTLIEQRPQNCWFNTCNAHSRGETCKFMHGMYIAGYLFAADSMGLTLFTFMQQPPERSDIGRWSIMVIEGHWNWFESKVYHMRFSVSG